MIVSAHKVTFFIFHAWAWSTFAGEWYSNPCCPCCQGGFASLHIVAAHGRFHALRLLLEAGATVDLQWKVSCPKHSRDRICFCLLYFLCLSGAHFRWVWVISQHTTLTSALGNNQLLFPKLFVLHFMMRIYIHKLGLTSMSGMSLTFTVSHSWTYICVCSHTDFAFTFKFMFAFSFTCTFVSIIALVKSFVLSVDERKGLSGLVVSANCNRCILNQFAVVLCVAEFVRILNHL